MVCSFRDLVTIIQCRCQKQKQHLLVKELMKQQQESYLPQKQHQKENPSAYDNLTKFKILVPPFFHKHHGAPNHKIYKQDMMELTEPHQPELGSWCSKHTIILRMTITRWLYIQSTSRKVGTRVSPLLLRSFFTVPTTLLLNSTLI